MEDRIKLDVSGQMFMITLKQLENGPPSKLVSICRSDKSTIIIDRPPDVFSAILGLYQTGELHLPPSLCPASLLNELEYWNISPELISSCCFDRLEGFLNEQEAIRDFRKHGEERPPIFNLLPCNKISSFRSKVWTVVEYTKPTIIGTVYFIVSLVMILASILALAYSTDPNFTRSMTACESVDFLLATDKNITDAFKINMEQYCAGNPNYSKLAITENPDGLIDIHFSFLSSADIAIPDSFFSKSENTSIPEIIVSFDNNHNESTSEETTDNLTINGSEFRDYDADITTEKPLQNLAGSVLPKKENHSQDENAAFWQTTVAMLRADNVVSSENIDEDPNETNLNKTDQSESFNVTKNTPPSLADSLFNISQDGTSSSDSLELVTIVTSTEKETTSTEVDLITNTTHEDPNLRIVAPIFTLESLTKEIPQIKIKVYSLVICGFVTSAFFTLDFILRLLCCPCIVRYFTSFINIMDMIALASTYLHMFLIFLYQYQQYNITWLVFLEYTQMARAFRLFRTIANVRAGKILSYTILKNGKDLLIIALFLIAGMCVYASCFYLSEDNMDVPTVPDAWYWAIITMTTVGYGDMAPKTFLGRMFASLTAVTGILLLALTVPIFANNFMTLYNRVDFRDAGKKIEQWKKNVLEDHNAKQTNVQTLIGYDHSDLSNGRKRSMSQMKRGSVNV